MQKSVRTIMFTWIVFTLLITACFPEGSPGSGTPGSGSPTPPGGGVGTLPGDIAVLGTPGVGVGTLGLTVPLPGVFIGTLPFLDIGTLPPSPTPTPWFHIIIVRDILCYLGPGPEWNVAGAIRKDTSVPVIARGSTQGWLVVSFFKVPCWLELRFADTGGANPDDLPTVTPGPRNTKTPTATDVPKEGCMLNYIQGGGGICVYPCPDKPPSGFIIGGACTP